MAVKSIYVIIGYTNEDNKNSWNTYGSFTTLAKATAHMEELAIDIAAGYHDRAEHEPEEYGDMAYSYLRYSPGYAVVPCIELMTTEGKPKHLRLEVLQSSLRSGKDADI